jgi:ribosomal peptide maturation radical SAM protein 1
MARVLLINPPFSSILRPSIGLTQIKSRLESCYGARVSVEVIYLNMDFSHYMGHDFYTAISDSMEHHVTGIGDWFFRQVAFPELPHNTEEYFRRCYPHPSERNTRLRRLVEQKRLSLADTLMNLIDKYRLDQADIAGFSSTFAQNGACMALTRLLKARRPNLVTVMGGANCESAMGQEIVRHVRSVDFVFSGPSLLSFPDFVGYYLDGKWEQLHAIPGVFSKKNLTHSSLAVIGQSRVAPIGEDLDINANIDLDYTPYLTKFEQDYPGSKSKPSLLFETSRGCWWGDKAHCTFCGLNGESMAYRAMNPTHALELLNSLFLHAHRCSSFECVDNILPRHFVREVYSHVSAPSNTSIFCEVKADLSIEELSTLAKAGVRQIQPGIESLATSTLRLMKKGTTATRNVQFLRDCLMAGIQPVWNLLVGFPGEGEDVYRKYCADLPLLTHLFPPQGVFPVRFDRFSPYFTEARDYKLDLYPLDYYSLTYPFNKETLANFAYYFADRNVEADYFVTMVDWLGEVKGAAAKWRNRWNNDPNVRTDSPKLHFHAEMGGTILDSRSGELRRYDVGNGGRKLLESIYKPKAISTLVSEFPSRQLADDLGVLYSHGLVFREGDRVVGLVCPSLPPPVSVLPPATI